MGRLIVRKLVLQGFRVSVLVRSLSSETLNLLGSGVSYSYGDMTDYRSLLDAMEDVDRVIFAADAEDDEELDGLQAVLRSFQDTRTFMYGDAESTKLSLFKMRRDRDFNRWRVEASSGDVASRLQSAGVGPKPSTVLWKRSGAHRNGVFVGRVFDTYLGAAVIGCSLSGLLLGATPVTFGTVEAAAPASLPASEAVERRVDVTDGKAYTRAEFIDEYGGTPAAAAEVPLNLGEYSGLVIRAISDGKKYTAVLRTPEYARSGLEYHADFTATAATKRFDTVRLPFSTFVPVRDGRRVLDAPELDRRQLVGLALAFYPQRNNPSQTTGEFYLSVANVKAFRKRDEPEIIYISDAEAAAGDSKEDKGKRGTLADAEAAAARAQAAPPISARAQVKLRGERMLRSSGLTYFIVRPTQLTDAPSSRRLSFTQGSGPVTGTVSRADVAEVAVRSLLDPRACNVACTITESDTVAPSMYEQDISKALEVLQPNR
ncbi:NADH:ubiquinone oxidoreductase complex i intermediate-associated protein 30 [Chrysochromulina tobinii]|uniref:NADH:ubiquinone oxidoreductase complex i intermediate-associated protein 30 n=1 Tax=Chrysochromulina tobinii TaxID=1460289 RepID=A0A0M0JG41_9EUKA|nr:NADH:ubiquinone oxidoreductase complex i intermediate-associated protein 30 [Chrysochromulina tobinii]|eukprot:KOO25556.1 NADH:ubiquinone oxidoreductase complex i intermediate-associated protein 30 [Chrysochromulina sp. CCMP291]